MTVDYSERAPGILTDVHVIENVAIITVQGVLPQHDYTLVGVMRDVLAEGHQRIVIDLAQVRHTGDYGVANLVQCFVETQRRGASLRLIINRYLEDVLRTVHLLPVFTVHAAQDEAVSAPW
jgi:anti-anti-sigma regulatory factor